MSSEIKDYVSNCSVCNAIQPSQVKEPLLAHEIPQRPWNKVATDLFSINSDNFVVIVDYCSNFVEVEQQLPDQSFKPWRWHLDVMAYRIVWYPTMGRRLPQQNFKSLQNSRSLIILPLPHITLNLMAKPSVLLRFIRHLWRRPNLLNLTYTWHCSINFCNTQTKPTNLSPAQRLFGRRTQTQLPQIRALLTPETLR